MATMHEMKPMTERALRCHFNIKWISQPALGKTKLIEAIAREQQELDPEFFFCVMDGGTMQPTDTVMAMPNMDKRIIELFRAGWLPNAYDTPDLRGIIYIGEIPLMGLEVEKGFQKLQNHEDVGGFRIPDGVIFVGDGNRLSDKSGAQKGSRANASRYVRYELEYDAGYALDIIKKHYHVKVAAFCDRNPGCIDNYQDVFHPAEPRPANDLMTIEGDNGIWASLRSWRRVSDILQDVEDSGVTLLPGEIEANVGEGIAKSFLTFLTMLDHLASYEAILANPKKVTVPTKADEQFALASMLAILVDRKTFEDVAVFMQRFPHEIQVVFVTAMNDRLKKDAVNQSGIHSSRTFKVWSTQPWLKQIMAGASA